MRNNRTTYEITLLCCACLVEDSKDSFELVVQSNGLKGSHPLSVVSFAALAEVRQPENQNIIIYHVPTCLMNLALPIESSHTSFNASTGSA